MKSLSLVLLLASAASALDVEIDSVTCDSSLPVTADIGMKCRDGSRRCTFGQQVTVFGNLYYSGVENSGTQDNTVYASGKISLMAMDFTLFDMIAFPLCGDESAYISSDADNQNDCPGDGVYNYSVPYRLPNAGAESASWLASGWQGVGYLDYYAEPDESMQIGHCELTLKTFVTHNSAEDGLFATPSAATTMGIILGSVAAIAVMCMFCYCCQRKRRIRKKTHTLQPGDDMTSHFRRMYDDDVPKSIGTSRQSRSGGTMSVSSQLP